MSGSKKGPRKNIERQRPDREAEEHIQERTKIQKETGVSYGRQGMKKDLKEQEAYFDQLRQRRPRIGPKLKVAIEKSPFSMRALSIDLGYGKSWLFQLIEARGRIEREYLERICVIIRANPNDMIEED